MRCAQDMTAMKQQAVSAPFISLCEKEQGKEEEKNWNYSWSTPKQVWK
jgi:hypothetical protein